MSIATSFVKFLGFGLVSPARWSEVEQSPEHIGPLLVEFEEVFDFLVEANGNAFVDFLESEIPLVFVVVWDFPLD